MGQCCGKRGELLKEMKQIPVDEHQAVIAALKEEHTAKMSEQIPVDEHQAVIAALKEEHAAKMSELFVKGEAVTGLAVDFVTNARTIEYRRGSGPWVQTDKYFCCEVSEGEAFAGQLLKLIDDASEHKERFAKNGWANSKKS